MGSQENRFSSLMNVNVGFDWKTPGSAQSLPIIVKTESEGEREREKIDTGERKEEKTHSFVLC